MPGRVASETMATGSSGERPAFHEISGDSFQMLDRHIDDDDGRPAGDGGPIDRSRLVSALVMAGEKGDRLVHIAMGDRNTGIGQPTDTRRNPRDHPEGNAGCHQGRSLLAATAEHEGITALEPEHPFSLAGQFDQAKRDISLQG